jgi:RNA polymerase sigma-70 factor, ECF subfamily
MNDTITKELIQACKNGRRDSFAILMNACRSYAFSVAFRLLCDEEDTKDAVQESFIRLWKALDRYDGRAKFTTWFYAIVSNVCLDALRARKRTVGFVSLNDELDEAHALVEEVRIDVALSNGELARIISSLTDTLPETQRLVFVLRDLEDLTVDEVCEITGLSCGSVKTNLHYARRTIRKILNNKYKLTGGAS